MISKNRLLGLLCLGDKVRGRPLSGSEILLLKGLADELALAIENTLISQSTSKDHVPTEMFPNLSSLEMVSGNGTCFARRVWPAR